MSKYPKGSMGDSERKTENKIMAAFSAAVVLIFLMQFFNLFDTYLYDYFSRANFAAKLTGGVLYACAALWMWVARDIFPVSMGRISPAGVAFLLLLLAIATASNFNFDLSGIEP